MMLSKAEVLVLQYESMTLYIADPNISMTLDTLALANSRDNQPLNVTTIQNAIQCDNIPSQRTPRQIFLLSGQRTIEGHGSSSNSCINSAQKCWEKVPE